ncbi:MAG: response regulator transcription factor [Bacillota bacterium]
MDKYAEDNAQGSRITILIVEDEENIRFSLSSSLEREGYRVLSVPSGEEGLALVRKREVDLVLLDLMLPDLSGLDVSRLIRRESNVPIIMVTARDSETDIIAGLEMGADDYVTKPFSLGVLLARIRANLRRDTAGPTDSTDVVRLGSLTLEPESYTARIGEQKMELTPRLFNLLLFLGKNEGTVCTRDRILNEVWGYDYVGETRTVDVHIHWLRGKLRESVPDVVLETVRGVGYRLVVRDR